MSEGMKEDLAIGIKVKNWTVTYTCWERAHQFSSMGWHWVHPGQMSCSGITDQQTMDSTVCVLLFGYSLTFCFVPFFWGVVLFCCLEFWCVKWVGRSWKFGWTWGREKCDHNIVKIFNVLDNKKKSHIMRAIDSGWLQANRIFCLYRVAVPRSSQQFW